jgi:hypothetical protein
MTTPDEQRLSSLLKRAVPEPPLELSAAQVTAGDVTARHASRPRRRWLTPAIAVTAAAAAAIAAVNVLPLSAAHPGASPRADSPAKPTVRAKRGEIVPSAVPTTAPPVTPSFRMGNTTVTAAYVLDKAAEALGSQSQVGTSWPTGAYWHIEQETTQASCPGQAVISNIWTDFTGGGAGDGTVTGPKSPNRYCAEENDPPYSISGVAGGSPFSIGEKTYSWAQLIALPTDPAKLWPIVRADEQLPFSSADPGAPKSGQSDLFESIWNLLTSEPVPTALAKALYEVTAKIPGVTVEGTYTDSLGRTGTVLHIGMWTMAVDTSDGQVLAMQQAAGPPVTVCGDSGCHQAQTEGANTTVYLSQGWAAASTVPKVAGGSSGSAPQAVPTSSAPSQP